MALQSQAQLLDELMGKNRNAGPGIKINSVRFDDEEVCKYALCGFCPHDLFVNTRADLGPCDKIHDEELTATYEKSSRYGKLGYEEDFERFIRSLLMDVEKKIKRGVERLKLTQNDPNHKTPSQLRNEKILSLKEQINAIIKEAESLGELGEIDQAQTKLESCEKLKSECKYLELQAEQNALLIDQKIMEVCETCGSFLIVNDAQARVEEHVAGKQHMGYAKLRTALEDIRKKRQEELEKREKERSSKRNDRDRDRDRERSRDRDRDRRTDRYRSDRDYDRDRDRSDRYSSSRRNSDKTSSSKHRSDRDRRRSRTRSRDRKSDKRQRSRSRSRENKRKSSTNGLNDSIVKMENGENRTRQEDAPQTVPAIDKIKEEGEQESEADEGEIKE